MQKNSILPYYVQLLGLLIIHFIILLGGAVTAVYADDVDFAWAKSMGGYSWDNSFSIAVDASGNVYTTGNFQGTADFDPGEEDYNLTSGDNGDIFISKLDSNGDFVWAKGMGSNWIDQCRSIFIDGSGAIYTTGTCSQTCHANYPMGDTFIFINKQNSNGDFIWLKAMVGGGVYNYNQGTGVYVDGSGNVYTTGYFSKTVDFDPGDGTYNLTSTGDFDIFVSKLDSNGDFLWAKAIGGASSDMGRGISVDGSGNVYTTGFFYGTVDFDPGDGVFNLVGGSHEEGFVNTNSFISKLDSDGDFLWAKGMDGIANGSSISVDESGNVYTTGSFYGTVDFDPGDGVFNLVGGSHEEGFVNTNSFISKLDSDGDFLWAKGMDGIANGSSISVDESGNVYTTGSFYGTVDFDPSEAVYRLTSAGNSDIFINKLNSNGDFAWAVAIGGTVFDYGRGISVDESGNIYTTGSFYETIDFDPGEEDYNLTSAGAEDIFISKLDSNGDFVWAKSMGGTLSEWGKSIFVDDFNNVYATGSFSGTVDFDPGEEDYNLTTAGVDDIFVTKFDASGPFSLSVSLSGNGTVTSYPSGIYCPSDCTESYEKNTSVTLTASPSNDAIFGSWSGDGCKGAGTGTCTVTMDRDREINASFGKEGGLPWLLPLLKKKE